jgi:hypothetical protein
MLTRGAETSAGKKVFFSVEKNQKTFFCAVADLAGGTNT